MAAPTPDAAIAQPAAAGQGLIDYPLGREGPATGALQSIAAGLRWARLPLPGSLGHINVWLIDGAGGSAIVDTGIALDGCRDAWDALFAGPLADWHYDRIIVTHMHPDHVGLAGWLQQRIGAPLMMTRGEYLTALLAQRDEGGLGAQSWAKQRIIGGWPEEWRTDAAGPGPAGFRRITSPLPGDYIRIMDGERLTIGDGGWRVHGGSGHSPEHACLLNEGEGLLISGDQILPRISSNVSLRPDEPEGDPLGDWLDSLDALLQLPADLLVCPAHGEPFTGLHARAVALRDDHLNRLDALEQALDRPLCAIDGFALLFGRPIGPEQRALATGEALAHFRRLEREGRAIRTIDADGVWWWQRA